MNLNPIKANMTELDLCNGTKVLFSYRTPVAVHISELSESGTRNWHQYKTDKRWSNTTQRHINAWNPMGGAYGIRPQEYFDNLTAEVK
jgi:hypothetical protein